MCLTMASRGAGRGRDGGGRGERRKCERNGEIYGGGEESDGRRPGSDGRWSRRADTAAGSRAGVAESGRVAVGGPVALCAFSVPFLALSPFPSSAARPPFPVSFCESGYSPFSLQRLFTRVSGTQSFSPPTMSSRVPKQSMSELKLRRLSEHNQRLREDLARPRIRVSEASKRYVFYIFQAALRIQSLTCPQLDQLLQVNTRPPRKHHHRLFYSSPTCFGSTLFPLSGVCQLSLDVMTVGSFTRFWHAVRPWSSQDFFLLACAMASKAWMPFLWHTPAESVGLPLSLSLMCSPRTLLAVSARTTLPLLPLHGPPIVVHGPLCKLGNTRGGRMSLSDLVAEGHNQAMSLSPSVFRRCIFLHTLAYCLIID